MLKPSASGALFFYSFLLFFRQGDHRVVPLGIAAAAHAGADKGDAVTDIEGVLLYPCVRVFGGADCAAQIVIADIAAEGV